jgi:hypothetical protein
MVGCAEKPAKSPWAQKTRQKKTCRKFAKKKKHQTGKRPKMADRGWIQKGYQGLFSIEKSGLPHDR